MRFDSYSADRYGITVVWLHGYGYTVDRRYGMFITPLGSDLFQIFNGCAVKCSGSV